MGTGGVSVLGQAGRKGGVGGAHLETEDGVVVLVAAHCELGRGVEGWVERDQHGAVFLCGEVLQLVHPVYRSFYVSY